MAANSFARRQLERYGWEQYATPAAEFLRHTCATDTFRIYGSLVALDSGKGLGRTLSGGAEAIKVKVKQNKDGVRDAAPRHILWWAPPRD